MTRQARMMLRGLNSRPANRIALFCGNDLHHGEDAREGYQVKQYLYAGGSGRIADQYMQYAADHPGLAENV